MESIDFFCIWLYFCDRSDIYFLYLVIFIRRMFVMLVCFVWRSEVLALRNGNVTFLYDLGLFSMCME